MRMNLSASFVNLTRFKFKIFNNGARNYKCCPPGGTYVKEETPNNLNIISDELHETIIGLVLGDLHIRKRFKNANLVFKGSSKHTDYIMNLYKMFSNFCKSKPRIYPAKLGNKIYHSVAFETLTNSEFNYYHNLFYNGKKKVIPNNVSDLITARSLAY